MRKIVLGSMFFTAYFEKDMSEEELERMIDFHLDRLIELLRLKG